MASAAIRSPASAMGTICPSIIDATPRESAVANVAHMIRIPDNRDIAHAQNREATSELACQRDVASRIGNRDMMANIAITAGGMGAKSGWRSS